MSRPATPWAFTVLGLLALGATVLPSEAPAEPDTPSALPTVAPGGLVQWSGSGIEACRHGGSSWPPLEGACWYPVDLLTESERLVLERRRAGRWENVLVQVADYPYPVQRLQIRDRSRVDLSPEDLRRARRESARVGELWDRRTPRRFSLPLAPPLAEMPDSGRFGARRIINGEPRNPHTGADYAAPAGTEVRAVAAGTVLLAEEHFFAGNSVFVDHGDGLISMYFHLLDRAVEAGTEVARGQKIGTVGSTGRSTGPHLHLGFRWRGARIDPALLLEPARALRLE